MYTHIHVCDIHCTWVQAQYTHKSFSITAILLLRCEFPKHLLLLLPLANVNIMNECKILFVACGRVLHAWVHFSAVEGVQLHEYSLKRLKAGNRFQIITDKLAMCCCTKTENCIESSWQRVCYLQLQHLKQVQQQQAAATNVTKISLAHKSRSRRCSSWKPRQPKAWAKQPVLQNYKRKYFH